MYGRTENELIIEKRIEQKLDSQDDVIKNFYKWMNGKSVTTKEKYIYYVTQFLDYCKATMNVPVISYGDISLETLNTYIQTASVKKDGSGKNESSIIATRICAISTFFKYLKIYNLIETNICEYVDRPKIREKENITFLVKDEIKELLNNVEEGVGSNRAVHYQEKYKNRDMLICMLPIITGMRISAMRNINIEDIDMRNGTISVIEKENKHRIFQIPDAVLDLIVKWIEDRKEIIGEVKCETDALFICIYRKECRRISTVAINNLIKKYSATIPKKITAHKLRDTFATNLYNQTGDIYLVSEMLGHSNPETTRKYVRANDEQKKGAVKLMAELIS